MGFVTALNIMFDHYSQNIPFHEFFLTKNKTKQKAQRPIRMNKVTSFKEKMYIVGTKYFLHN